nr:MaoC family dehydratase [Stagnihabitans tardus]
MPPGLHDLGTLAPGDHWQTGHVTVSAERIAEFARLTGDQTALHLCDKAARAAGFPGQVAHGLLVVSLIEGLKAQAPVQLATHTALGWEVTFRAPVLAGGTLSARLRVEEVRRVGAKGLVVLAVEGWTETRVLTARARYFGTFTPAGA